MPYVHRFPVQVGSGRNAADHPLQKTSLSQTHNQAPPLQRLSFPPASGAHSHLAPAHAQALPHSPFDNYCLDDLVLHVAHQSKRSVCDPMVTDREILHLDLLAVCRVTLELTRPTVRL